MIELIIVSFVAGILTVLAPCLLPLLPVVIGGSGLHADSTPKISIKHPLIITISLVASIVIFTLLLKSTTLLLGVPAAVWNSISGGIVLLFGINMLFPSLWEMVMTRTGLQAKSSQLLAHSQSNNATKKDILLGLALGPVFNSCSPTYALIVAIILPTAFVEGMGYLFAYALGLGVILLLIAIFGRVLVQKLKWASNPRGIFQKVVGSIFIIVGLLIILGIDKRVQTFVLENGWYDPVMQIEESLR